MAMKNLTAAMKKPTTMKTVTLISPKTSTVKKNKLMTLLHLRKPPTTVTAAMTR